MIPVFSYYQLLQSKPAGGRRGGASTSRISTTRRTMAAYWDDVRLFFQRARGHASRSCSTSSRTSGATSSRLRGATTPRPCPAVVPGEPAADRGRIRAGVRPRCATALAPNVILAYHMSGWGTKHDIVYEKPPNATVRAYATRSAAFYRSLGAHFDLSFEDFSDRDAGFYQLVEDNPNTWFKPADFHGTCSTPQTFVRLAGIRMAAWQIPLGNTVMRAENNTNDHYQDNRVQWLLGPDPRAHLRAYVAAGLRRLPLRRRRRRQHVRLRRRATTA